MIEGGQTWTDGQAESGDLERRGEVKKASLPFSSPIGRSRQSNVRSESFSMGGGKGRRGEESLSAKHINLFEHKAVHPNQCFDKRKKLQIASKAYLDFFCFTAQNIGYEELG